MTMSNQERARLNDLNRPSQQPEAARGQRRYTIEVHRRGELRPSSTYYGVSHSRAFALAQRLAGEGAEWFSRGEGPGRAMGYVSDAATAYMSREWA
ncbi:MAG TPA: hypothetical protein VKY73_00500 [Polyangiaceae bacterium]|nr:hypothetical protein [Polyangiaceae bacterium]